MIRCLRATWEFLEQYFAYFSNGIPTTTGRPNVCGILHDVHRKEIPMPPEGAHGPCSSGPTLGESGYGPVGHVNHICDGESLCTSDGGLFLSMDGGLTCPFPDKTAISVADAFFSNIHYMPLWNAYCDSFGPRTGVRE